jgi:hypothetical protein
MTHRAFRAGLAAALAAASLACVLTLSACSGGNDPTATVTPSPTVSASPSPSPSVSLAPLTDEDLLALLPPEAAYEDIRGAIATAHFFLEEFNQVFLTGDLSIWDALSQPDCVFCNSVRDGVIELHDAGAYRDGGEFTFDDDATIANYYEETGYWYVTFSVSWTPTNDHYPDGSTTPDGDGGSAHISLEMEPVNGMWRVRDVGVEETG